MTAARRPRAIIGIGVFAVAALFAAWDFDKGSLSQLIEPPLRAQLVGATDPAGAPALFVLGDSLSDVGNAAALADWLLGEPFHPEHTVGFCNPADVYVYRRGCDDLFYRKSRVSDGPVAVEHLAAHLGLALTASFHTIPSRPGAGTNYAVASGKAAGPGPEDLTHQLDRLLVDHGLLLPPAALYVVMIGGNDAIDALQAAVAAQSAADAVAASDAIVAAAVDSIAANVTRLIEFGAERVIVANVPDLGVLPVVRLRAMATRDAEGALVAANAIVRELNGRLASRLAEIAHEHPAATLVTFDLYSAVRETAALGGRNGRDACFDSEAYRQNWTASRMFHADCAPAAGLDPRFDEFVFWDGLHPTGAAHAAIGAALIGTYVASAASTQR